MRVVLFPLRLQVAAACTSTALRRSAAIQRPISTNLCLSFFQHLHTWVFLTALLAAIDAFYELGLHFFIRVNGNSSSVPTTFTHLSGFEFAAPDISTF
jgi:hypothetical protein